MLNAQPRPCSTAEYLSCLQDFLDLYFLGCKVRCAKLPLHLAQGRCVHSLSLHGQGAVWAAALPAYIRLGGRQWQHRQVLWSSASLSATQQVERSRTAYPHKGWPVSHAPAAQGPVSVGRLSLRELTSLHCGLV